MHGFESIVAPVKVFTVVQMPIYIIKQLNTHQGIYVKEL